MSDSPSQPHAGQYVMPRSEERSPIIHLTEAIAGSPFNIAPEKEGELAEWCDKTKVFLDLADEPGFTFEVYPDTCRVKTTIATLEYLWAGAHGYLMLYDEYAQAQRTNGKTFDISEKARSRKAYELLRWATDNVLAPSLQHWPATLPAPAANSVKGSDIHVSNELFLCSTAWIIHHELAHLRLGHGEPTAVRSIADEKEADIEATRWILSSCTDSNQRKKRTYGIEAAILALQGIENPNTDHWTSPGSVDS